MSFNAVKKKAISDLSSGNYAHEGRNDIDEKNLLKTGEISANSVVDLSRMSRSSEHSSSRHHQDASIVIHVIKLRGWYLKFYFDPDTMFISVHQ